MRQSLILLLSLILSGSVISQELPSRLSMEEAIDFALENNRNAINAARDIDAAKKQKWETTASGFPQISANFDYQYFIEQPVQVVPAEFFGGEAGEFQEVIFGTQQQVNAFVRLDQKIVDGTYLVALQSARVFLDISKNAKTKTDLEIRKSVINAYGNVLLAEESVRILKKDISILEKNLNETQKIYENGFEEEESVEQLQITLTSLKSNFNNADRLKEIAYKMLNIVLGVDIYHDLTLTDNLETLAEQNQSLELLEMDNDPSNNIDYIIAENERKVNELKVKLEKSKALPQLSLFVNGGYQAFENNFTFFNNDQAWFGSSLVGVNLSVPIFSSGMRSASTQRAKINLDKSLTELEETEQRLKLEIESSKSDYKFALEDYQNKKDNIALAERIEQKNQTKFFEGVATSFELRQAQTQLYNAQQELLQAMLDVINSKAALETVLNTPMINQKNQSR
ncbi:MAG: TolC family protein [Bacteroidota bacterium]